LSSKIVPAIAGLAMRLACTGLCTIPAVVNAFASNSYVTATSGHFYRDGTRVRFWGENVQLGQITSSAHPYQEIDNFVNRVAALGYNGIRLWATQDTFYTKTSAGTRAFPAAQRSDGSKLDLFDYLVFKLASVNISIEMTALHNVGVYSLTIDPNPEVVNWSTQTIAKYPRQNGSYTTQELKVYSLAPYISSEWRNMMKAHFAAFLSHRNPYSNRTYAEETAVSAWELANESHFVGCALDKACIDSLPDAALQALDRAWRSSSYNIFSSTQAAEGLANHYSEYAKFVSKTFIDASNEMRAYARTFGNGVAAQPFIFNTGLEYNGEPNAVALYAGSQGDATSLDGYRSPLASSNIGGLDGTPWLPVSMGGKMPKAMQGFRVLGKPHVIYETSFYRPYPYRAEWGPVMAAYALKQDWDAVYLYSQGDGPAVYGTGNTGLNAEYGTQRLPDPNPDSSNRDCSTLQSKYTEGFKHGGDPVVQAGWVLGGRLVTSYLHSPDVQVTWKIDDSTLFSRDHNGFPKAFLDSMNDPRDMSRSMTMGVEFTGRETASCAPRCNSAQAQVNGNTGPICGVVNGGTAPLQWSQPEITFTYGAPRTYTPHGFDFSILPQPPRSPAYVTLTEGMGGSGVFWVDSLP